MVNFTCIAEGIPKPSISWRKGLQRLKSVRKSVETSDNGNVLTIMNIVPMNGGYYTCLATSEVGEDRIAARLRVLGKMTSLHCVDSQVISCRTVVPVFTTTRQTVHYELSGPAWLPCAAEGRPDPTIQWLKDGVDVSDEVRYQILANGTLYIDELQLRDAGVFECVATNGGGKVSLNITIDVLGTDSSLRLYSRTCDFSMICLLQCYQ